MRVGDIAIFTTAPEPRELLGSAKQTEKASTVAKLVGAAGIVTIAPPETEDGESSVPICMRWRPFDKALRNKDTDDGSWLVSSDHLTVVSPLESLLSVFSSMPKPNWARRVASQLFEAITGKKSL